MRLALVLTVTLLAVAPATAMAQTTERPIEHTLAVVGQGEFELAPDRGSFTASVIRTSPTSQGARSRANSRVTAIVAGLRMLGVARERIATSSIRVVRQRRRGRDRSLRVRYRAVAELQVSVDGVQRLGRAIDVAAGRGATSIEGPDLSFTPASRTSGQRQAEAAAIVQARTRADAAAAATGQRIVGVASIDLDPGSSSGADETSDSAASAPPIPAPAGAQPTRIFAGLQTFSATVRIRYLIEPAT